MARSIAANETEASAHGRRRSCLDLILITDDSPAHRRTLAAIVEGLGWRAYCVNAGEAAVEACTRERFAGVFLDFNMPGGDGVAAARAIRELGGWRKHTPIVLISADHDAALERTARAAGVDACLAKPARPLEIANALHTAFAQRAA